MSKEKIIVLGCGSIGLRHLSNLSVRADVELAAFDVNEASKEWVSDIDDGIVFFSDLEGILW